MTAGFKRAFDCEFLAVEMNKSAAEAYKLNFGDNIIVGSVSDALDDLPPADLVIGGPPCQGFSVANQVTDRSTDERNAEWMNYLAAVKKSEASAFVIENVPQIVDHGVYRRIVDLSAAEGFRTSGVKLCAADYGCPTIRTRFFIVGVRDGLHWTPPVPTHCESSIDDMFSDEPALPWRTLRDAIGDLPDPPREKPAPDDDADPLHFDLTSDADRARWAVVPDHVHYVVWWLRENHPELIHESRRSHPRGKFNDTYGFMCWDRPGLAITCNISSANGRFGHPNRKRLLTPREAARVQDFPDSHRFFGGTPSITRQIGNAVPVGLSSAVARSVKECFERG